MPEYKELTKPAKSIPIWFIFVISLFIILIFSLVLFYIDNPYLVIKGSPPESVISNTYTKIKINSTPFMEFNEYYQKLNQKQKIDTNRANDYDFIPRYEYDYEFYHNDNGYYDRCRSKKVNLNYTNPKNVSFMFNYLEREFKLDIMVYEDLYKFTDNLKNQDCYFEENKYTIGYFQDPYNNNFLKSLSKQFIDLKEYYTDDEILEIVTVFVQSINYGTDLTELNRYPYETIYEQEGNCLDKTVLLVGILNKLGYSTYVILGDTGEYHSLAGIICENGNIEYQGKEICFIETTIFSPISADSDIKIEEIVNISIGTKVYNGSNYGPGLVKFFNITKKEIRQIELEVSQKDNVLDELNKEMCKTDCVICINQKVDFKKSSELIKACYDAKQYNKVVETYNKEVKEYNNLIELWYKKYYELEKSMFGNVKIIKN